MNTMTLIAALKIIAGISILLALLCLIPIILITIRNTPSQLKIIIEIEQIRNDPRHRKPTLQQTPEEAAAIDLLLRYPDTSGLTGWHGHCP